jgi:dTDP-glucose 4,6-dehydratase
MKVFVTGGAGFIGSHFARHLLATSDDWVTVFDALTYAGNLANLADLDDDPRFRFVHGDVCDRAAVEAAMRGHDAVVHFAAESHVDRSLLYPEVFTRTNCAGTTVVCDVASRLGVARFLHVSTDEVYGSIAEGSFVEADPLRPASPYSATKAASELIALAHTSTHELPLVVTRSTNVFGSHQFPEKLIPFFVTTLLEGGRLPLYGDGLNVRDWLPVEDNCRALDLVLRSGAVGEVYNVGAGNEKTSREVTDRVLASLGAGRDAIEYVEDRQGHDRRYSVATGKVRALGWTPRLGFDDAIESTIRWYVDNEAWWRPLMPCVQDFRAHLQRVGRLRPVAAVAAAG